MHASLSASRWPLPEHPAGQAGTWRFARRVVLGDGSLAAQGGGSAWQWSLRRQCALTPRGLLLAFSLLAALSLSVGTGFWIVGAPLVLAFTGLEIVALILALVATARHAGDHETLTLVGPQLLVERSLGTQVSRQQLPVAWLEVEPQTGPSSLVQLRSQGQTVRVGRFVQPQWRGELARELRSLVRQAREARWTTEPSPARDHDPGPGAHKPED
jgi:uncharacterized membrane protein